MIPHGAAEGREFLRKDELRMAIRALTADDRDSLAPDPLGYQDYYCAADMVATELTSEARAACPSMISFFPYPKGQGQVRWATMIHPKDQAIMRAATDRIVHSMWPLRNEVHSHRLAGRPKPPDWRFSSWRKCNESFEASSLRALMSGDVSAMYVTDVAAYYPSIDLGCLTRLLHESGCDADAVTLITGYLWQWQNQDGLRGLPIGPASSAALGDVYLLPLDSRIASVGIHARYVDDVRVFLESASDFPRLQEVTDSALTDLRLSRSVEKTAEYQTALEAIDALCTSTRLASFGGSVRTTLTMQEADDLFEAVVRGDKVPSMKEYRAGLGAKLHRGRLTASDIETVAANPDLMNIDPRRSAEFVGAWAAPSSDVVANVMSALDRDESIDTIALTLHLLRLATAWGLGNDEGRRFEEAASDESRHPTTRAWAWIAYGSTPAWTRDRALAVALEEPSWEVARSALGTLQGRETSSGLRDPVELFAGARPDLLATATWVAA